MSDDIEREAAYATLTDYYHNIIDGMHSALRKALSRVPAADVAPVRRGHYHKRYYYREATKSYDIEMKVCSECGAEWSFDAETGVSDYNYCPNCGAKMEKTE